MSLHSKSVHTAPVTGNEALPLRFRCAHFHVTWSLHPAHHARIYGWKRLRRAHNQFTQVCFNVEERTGFIRVSVPLSSGTVLGSDGQT